MKRIVVLFMFGLLLFNPHLINAQSPDSSVTLNLHTEGLKDTISTEASEVPSISLNKNSSEELVLVKGEKSELVDTYVTQDKFSAVINDISNNKKYHLDGTIDISEDDVYLYRGIVNKDDKTTFYALVEKGENNKYKSYITIEKFNDDDEVIFGESFEFNGDNQPSIESISNSYNEITPMASTNLLGGSKGYGIHTVASAATTRATTGKLLISVRSTTISQQVMDEHRRLGRSPSRASINAYDLSMWTNSNSYFMRGEPTENNVKSFRLPVYLGPVVGLQYFDVTTSSTSVSSNSYDFMDVNYKWNSTSSAYIDDRDAWRDGGSGKTFGARIQWNSDVSFSLVNIHLRTEFGYSVQYAGPLGSVLTGYTNVNNYFYFPIYG